MYCKYGLIAEKLKSSPQNIYRRHHWLCWALRILITPLISSNSS